MRHGWRKGDYLIILVAASGNSYMHYLAGRFPGKIGMIMSPSYAQKPKYYFPYALDNGAFLDWNENAFIKLLLKARTWHKPMFTVAPDVVGSHEETIKLWPRWYEKIKSFDYPVAFVCQEGCQPKDVPREADVCFIGGKSTKWKLGHAERFVGICKHLHIGRVSTYNRYKWAETFADSVDGSKLFAGGPARLQPLIDYFEGSKQCQLFST